MFLRTLYTIQWIVHLRDLKLLERRKWPPQTPDNYLLFDESFLSVGE